MWRDMVILQPLRSGSFADAINEGGGLWFDDGARAPPMMWLSLAAHYCTIINGASLYKHLNIVQNSRTSEHNYRPSTPPPALLSFVSFGQ